MRTKILPTKVETIEDAKLVIQFLENILGGGFHPDTPIADYVFTLTGIASFTKEATKVLQPLLNDCFKVMGDYIYDYSWELYMASQPAGTFDLN